MFETPQPPFAPINSYLRKKKSLAGEVDSPPPPEYETQVQVKGRHAAPEDQRGLWQEQAREAAIGGIVRRFERAPQWRRGEGAEDSEWRTTLARPEDQGERRTAIAKERAGDVDRQRRRNGEAGAESEKPFSFF